MQASVDQLRDEKNKTLREVLKSVQEQLHDARSLLQARLERRSPLRSQVPLQLRSERTVATRAPDRWSQHPAPNFGVESGE
jgi:hypothetical protein